MAKKRITKKQMIKKKGKVLNTKWINNAMRSVGSISATVFKDMAPTVFETGKEIGTSINNVRKTIQGTSMQDVGKQLSGNKYISLGKKMLDNAIDDLKSGNLDNQQRMNDSMMEGMFGDNSDDIESMFSDFDDGESSVTFNYFDDGDDQGLSEATLRLANSIDNNTEANLKASKATIDSMIAVSSAGLLQNQEIGNNIIEKLGNIDNTLSSILQYHEENTTQFYEATMAALEKFGTKMDEDDDYGYGNDKGNGASVLTAKGSLNPAEYKNYIKKNLNDAFKGTQVGSLVEMVTSSDQMLEMAVSNPIGFIGETVAKGLVPHVVSSTLKNVEDVFSGFMPTMLKRLSDWRSTEEKGVKGALKKFIGQVFGLNVDRLEDIDIGEKVTKDAAVFDGVTRNAIVEVVPKYLRESTAYLKQIAAHFNIDTTKAVQGSEVYDAATNSYIKVEDVQKNIAKSITDTVIEAFDSSDFGKALRQGGSALQGKDAEKYNKFIDQFFVMLERSDKALDFGNPDKANNQMNDIINLLDGSKKDRELLLETIKQLRENQAALHTATAAQLNAQNSRNKELENLTADFDMRNGMVSGITSDTNIDQWIDETMGYNRSIERRKAEERQEKKKEAKDNREAEKEYRKQFGARPSAAKLVSAGLDSEFDDKNRFKSNENSQRARIQVTDEDTGFAKFLKGSANHVRNGMYGLMTGGNPREVMAEFAAVFTDQMKNMWEGVKENFFKPLANQLFGTKDSNGYSQGGLLSGTQNRIKDVWKLIGYQMNGKGYVDSQGVEHPDVSKDENETVVGRMKGIFREIGDSVKYRLFGSDDEGEEGDKKKKGIVNTFTDSLSKGLAGWKEALFGGDDDKDIDETVEDIKKNMVDAIPDATIGATAGAIMGGMAGSSLLGTMIGGPIGGAVVGIGGALLSRSEKFKDYLFGPKDPEDETKRLGGLISKKTQDLFSNPKMKKSIIGGAALGVVKNMVFGGPGGLMGMLVGGPIGGALMGAGFGLLKESSMFQEFLYGNDEKGRVGIIQQFNKMFGKKEKTSKEAKEDTKKMLGMGVIGALGGGLTSALVGKVGLLGAMATPFGPIGGAIAGLAIGIKANNGHFKEWLFGKEDPETGKKKGGMIQKFANFVHVEVLSPMKASMQNVFDDIKLTMEYKVLEPVRLAFIPLTKSIKGFADNVKKKITGFVSDIGTTVKKDFIEPVMQNVGKVIFDPIRSVMKTVGNVVYEGTKSVVTLPFTLMKKVADIAESRIRKVTRAIGRSFHKFIIKPIAKTVNNVVLKPLKKMFGTLFKVVGGIITTPFKVIGGVSTYLNNKFDERRANKDPRQRDGEDYRTQNRNSRADYKQAKAQARIDKRKRNQLDANRREMARILGYEESEFTEANMRKAEQMAQLKGMKKPKWKKTGGLTFDETAEDKVKAKLAQMSNADIANQRDNEQDVPTRQLSVTQRIFQFLQNRFGKKDDNNRNQTPNNVGEGQNGESSDNNGRNDLRQMSIDEAMDEVRADLARNEDQRSDIQKMADEIEEAGGLWKYTKQKAQNAYNNSFIKKGINKVFKQAGQARANGGDAEENEPILVGDGGTDPDAAEIFVPKTSGTVLSQRNGGIKVYVEGISKQASDAIGGAVSAEDSNEEGVGEVSADLGDVSAIASSPIAANSEVKLDANGNVLPAEVSGDSSATIASLVGGSEGRSEKEQEALEDAMRDQAEKDKNAAELEDVRNAHSFQTRQAQEAAKAANDRELNRDKMMQAQLDEARAGNKESKSHFKEWAGIFSKKGLITGGLIAAIPLVMKLFPIVSDAVSAVYGWFQNLDLAGVIKNAVGSILEDFGFGNKNNTNGMDSTEKAEWEVNDLKDFLVDLPKDPIGATLDYVMGDDGLTDAKSGAKVNYATHKVKKVVKKGGKVAKVGKKVGKGVDKLTGKRLSKAYDKTVGKRVKDAKLNRELKKAAKLDKRVEKFTNFKDFLANKVADFKTNWNIKKSGGMHTSAELPWRSAAKSTGDDVAEAAGKKLGKKAAKEGIESGSQSLLTKALDALSTGWDNMMSAISEKLASKSGKLAKVGSSKLGQATKGLFKKATQCLSKNFGKVSTKIAAILGGDAALMSTGVGAILVGAKNLGMAAILGINEASNPRNLFYVDSEYDCDWIMYAIAAGIGALKGTTPGSVIDIVNELVASILGLDLIHEAACAIYNLICNALGRNEKYEKLEKGKEKQKKNYEKYKEKQIKEQYSAYAKSKGKTEEEYTMDQYRADLESGAATLDIDSFVDFNHKQNKTIGAKTVDLAVGTGKKVSNTWKSLRGYTTSTFYDEKTGITYEKNEDDTYSMYDKDGKKLGDIAEANVDTSKMKETKTEHKGSAGSTVAALTNTVHNTVGDAGISIFNAGKHIGGGIFGGVKDIGSGIGSGAKQIFSGDILGGGATIAKGIGGGIYKTGEGIVKGGADLLVGAGKTVKNIGGGIVDTAKGLGEDIWNLGGSAASWIGDKVGGIGKKAEELKGNALEVFGNFKTGLTNLVTSETEEVYRNPVDGTYYKSEDGKWFLYNNNDDKISKEPLPDGDLISLVRNGVLIQDTITIRQSGLGKAKDAVIEGFGKAKDAVGGAFKKAGKALGDAASWIGDKAGSAWKSVLGFKDKIGKGITNYFTSEKATVYRNPEDGSYYKLDGKKWNLYNNNGDKISKKAVTNKELENLIKSGAVVEDEITIRESGLSKTKDAIIGGLGKAKDAIGGAFKKAGKALGDAASWVGDKAGKAWDSIKSFTGKAVDYFSTSKKDVYVKHDGSYYDADGKYYSANSERIKSGDIKKDELSDLISSGIVTKTEKTIEPKALTDFKGAISKAGSAIKGGWNKFKGFVGDVASGIGKAGSKIVKAGKKAWGKVTKTAYKAVLAVAKEVYMNPDGSYYDSKGKYYTAQGERVKASDISQEDLAALYKSGAVTKHLKPDFSKVKKAVNGAFKKITGAASKAWNGLKSFGGKFLDGAAKLKDKLGEIGSTIKEKGIFGAIGSLFETKTKEAWYAPDGSYYTVNKDGTYNHYSATNDLLQENIKGKDAEYIDTQITTGVFKKDTITEQSAASEAINGMKDAISKGWETAKGTVVNGWNKIKSGLGSLFGFGGSGGFGGLGESINTLKDSISSYIPKKKSGKTGGFGPQDGTVNGFKYYSQKDSEWANTEYDSSKAKDNATMGEAGCGPTAMAMVASQYSGKHVTPVDMAKLAETGGFRDETGTNSNFISYAGNKYNLQNTRVEDPGAEYIKGELAKGKSVVLNGISGGMPNSPFTSKGHYVVAVGTDKDGNILVNDPRGAGYSTAYSPEMIQNQTRMAWSFGKAGKNDKVEYIKSKNPVGGSGKNKKNQKVNPDDFGPGEGSPAWKDQQKKKGKKGNNTTTTAQDTGKNWLAIVEAVKKAIASQSPGYSQSRYITITVNGRSMKARTDCSGYVGTCLKYYGVLDEGTNVTSRTFSSSNFPQLSSGGFTHMPFSSWENLKAGDIISLPGHVEIFCEIKDGQHYVYNCGSDKSVNSPTPTVSGHSSYTDVWRPGDAGSADGSLSAGATSDGTSGSASSESNDAASIITSHFSAFASKAMNGMLTGNWDNDFSSLTSTGTDNSGADSSASSGSDASAANIKGSNVAEKVWNFFTSNGYSPEATAGIMGNFQQESGMNPASIQGNGKGPAAGIAQWENYNTKSSRWKNLSDYAQKKGYKWTDLEPQLEFVHKELQGLGSFWKYQPNMSKAGTTATTYDQWKQSTDIDAATRQFEGAFERAGKPMMDNRLAAAKKYYSLYNGKKVGGKGGDEEAPLAIKDVQGLQEDPILSSLVGGYGKAKNTISKNNSISKPSTLRNSNSIRKTKKSLELSGSDTSKLESLLSKMITILESIDSHSGESVKKLDLLKTGNTTNVKTGDNITVQQSSGTNVPTKQTGESRNTTLANKIARGY